MPPPALLGAPDEDVVEVWETNWVSVRAFLDLSTQWHAVLTRDGLVYRGLDYAAVDVVLRHRLPAGTDAGAVFGDVQVMEMAALPPLNGAA